MPQSELGRVGVSGWRGGGAHLLSAREGMIEAGHVGHDGLLVGPQCTHDVYTPQRPAAGRERPV